jgi:flagellar hook-associated protein 3 FlgL
MNVRITMGTLARDAFAGVRRAQSNLLVSQEQIVTGRRINRPSDAPLDLAQAQRLRSDQSKIEQYQRNLSQATSELDYTASTVQELSDLFVQARELCLRGANSTADDSERQSLAISADQLLDSLIRRANTTFNGHFLFAGTANDTQPFEGVEGASGYVESVAYLGNDGRIELQVGPRARVQTNEPGSAVFTATPTQPSVFDALIRLRDLLLNADGLSDNALSKALSEHVGQVQQAHERIVDAASRLGWRASQLEFTRTTLENVGLANTEVLSSLEDADIATAAVRLQAQEVALQAALAIAARTLQSSILEYLE